MQDNALTQYIRLYEQNAAVIDSHSAPALNRLRPEALSALQGAKLPTQKTEGMRRPLSRRCSRPTMASTSPASTFR